MAVVESRNPTRPAEVLGVFPAATADDVDRAVRAAGEAQRVWALVPAPARAEMIEECGRLLGEHKAELATLVAREVGKIAAEAGGDVQEAIDM
ncbi:MAG TPA: aldehyde dehydrogenase family protein, partial [Acidimicrobiales bacterium]